MSPILALILVTLALGCFALGAAAVLLLSGPQ